MAEKPELFRYLNYRHFLRDWVQWRKTENRRFSYRVFARMAGLRTPSLLLHVINGDRNLTASSAEAFIQALRFTDEEAPFFRDLVELEQGVTPELRSEAFERISAVRRFRSAYRIEGEAFRCISRWYYAAIHELVSLPDFRPDPTWIAPRLRPPIQPEDARQALDELCTLGLLVTDEETGRLRQAAVSMVTPGEVLDLAVYNYHRGMSHLAAEAVRAYPTETRHMLGVTVSISEGLIPTLKQELQSLQARLLDLCDSEAATPERVMQINLQLFPLSAPDPFASTEE
ncbi:MAG: TIGR02147 family protein [Myxococcota bacterium]